MRTIRAALAAAAAVAALTGVAPAHALLGETITCTGTMTQSPGGANGAQVNGYGYLTCTVTPTLSPTATAAGTAVYVTTIAGWCDVAWRRYSLSIGGHSYDIDYGGVTAGGLAEAQYLQGVIKDGWFYPLDAFSPLAGSSVVTDTAVPNGVCLGTTYPVHPVAVQFQAVVPEVVV